MRSFLVSAILCLFGFSAQAQFPDQFFKYHELKQIDVQITDTLVMITPSGRLVKSAVSDIAVGGGSDNQILMDGGRVGTVQTITLEDGGSVVIDLADNDNDSNNEIQGLSSVLTESNDAGGQRITNLSSPGSVTDAAQVQWTLDELEKKVGVIYGDLNDPSYAPGANIPAGDIGQVLIDTTSTVGVNNFYFWDNDDKSWIRMKKFSESTHFLNTDLAIIGVQDRVHDLNNNNITFNSVDTMAVNGTFSAGGELVAQDIITIERAPSEATALEADSVLIRAPNGEVKQYPSSALGGSGSTETVSEGFGVDVTNVGDDYQVEVDTTQVATINYVAQNDTDLSNTNLVQSDATRTYDHEDKTLNFDGGLTGEFRASSDTNQAYVRIQGDQSTLYSQDGDVNIDGATVRLNRSLSAATVLEADSVLIRDDSGIIKNFPSSELAGDNTNLGNTSPLTNTTGGNVIYNINGENLAFNNGVVSFENTIDAQGGLSANNNVITQVSTAIDPNDAVNLQQLEDSLAFVSDLSQSVRFGAIDNSYSLNFILDGQSNASGGVALNTFPASQQDRNENVYVLQENRTTEYVQPLDPALGNHTFGSSTSGGMILPFAEQIDKYAKGSLPIYFLNVGRSGTQIEEHLPGDVQYQVELNKEQVWQEYLKMQGKPVRNILFWFQGESDANQDFSTAQAYEGRLIERFQNARDLYGEGLVIITREIETPSYPFEAEINQALNNVAASDSLVYIIPNNGFTYADGLHLDANGYSKLSRSVIDTLLYNGHLSGSVYPDEYSRAFNLSEMDLGPVRSEYLDQYVGNLDVVEFDGNKWVQWQNNTLIKGRDILSGDPRPTFRVTEASYTDTLQSVSFRFRYENATTSEFLLSVSLRASNSLYYNEPDGYTARFEDGRILILSNRGGQDVLGSASISHAQSTEYHYKVRTLGNDIIVENSTNDGASWSEVLRETIPDSISSRPQRISTGSVYFQHPNVGSTDVYLRDIDINPVSIVGASLEIPDQLIIDNGTILSGSATASNSDMFRVTDGNFGDTNDFDIEFRYRLNWSGTRTDFITNYGLNGYQLYSSAGGDFLVQARDGVPNTFTDQDPATGYDDGNWHILRLWRVGDIIRSSLDGVIINELTTSGVDHTLNTANFVIGDGLSASRGFDGDIDYIKVNGEVFEFGQFDSSTSYSTVGVASNLSAKPDQVDFNAFNVDTLSNKVVVNTVTGWGFYKDATYTSVSSLTVTAGDKISLPIDASTKIEDQLPLDVTEYWNVSDSTIVAVNPGDFVTVSVRFKAEPQAAGTTLYGSIDIGGTQNEIVYDKHTFQRGAGIAEPVTLTFTVFQGDTFVANGGKVKIEAFTGDIEIYDIDILINRTHKAR